MTNIPDKGELITLLPHKYPILMVDQVIDIDPKFSITKNTIKAYNPFVHENSLAEPAHIELMAQTTATIMLYCHYKDNPILLKEFRESGKAKLIPGYLVTLKNFIVYSGLTVEDEIIVSSTKTHEIDEYYSFECEIKKGNLLIAKGELAIYATP